MCKKYHRDTNMILLAVLLTLLEAGHALDHQFQIESPYNETECENCVRVNTTCYQIKYLIDLQAPFRSQVVIPKMELLHSKNILYYTFEPIFVDPEYSKIAFVNLDNPDAQSVINGDSVKQLNFGTFSIEQDTNYPSRSKDIIHLGGSDGIYEFNAKTNQFTLKNLPNYTIISIFYYKPHVYFVELNENIIKRREGDRFTPFEEYQGVKNFVIVRFENEDVIVFLSKKGLFVAKGPNEIVQISTKPFIRGITIDNKNEVYAWWIDDIYKVVFDKFDFSKSKLVKIASIDGLGAIAFDKNNKIIFNSGRSLYRLIDTNKTC